MTVVRAVTGSLPALLLLALVVGCGAGESSPAGSPGMPSTSPPAQPSPSPAPRRLTPEADGSHYTMTVGSTTALVVQGQGVDQPEVDGTSVMLIQVVNVTDSGAREWEVRAVEPGRSTITSAEPAFTITITVG